LAGAVITGLVSRKMKSQFLFDKTSYFNLGIFVNISQSAIHGVQAGEVAATSLSNWESICATLKNMFMRFPQIKQFFHHKSLPRCSDQD